VILRFFFDCISSGEGEIRSILQVALHSAMTSKLLKTE